FLTSGEDYGGVRKKKPSRFLIEAGFVDTKPEPTGEVLFKQKKNAIEETQDAGKKYLPKAFSFTQLTAYETCPWQYRFAHLLKVPVPGKPSFSFGKTIHSTLYEFFHHMQEQEEMQQGGLFEQAKSEEVIPPSLEDLLKIYESKWIAEWYYSKKQRDDYHKKGKDALKKFYKLHEKNWPKVLHLEKGFNLKLGEYTIKGAIDRVDQGDAGAEIIDYKTGDFPKTGKKDMKQLYIYGLALQEVFKLDAEKLSYYYIESNKKISEEIDAKKMEKVQAWLLEIIEKITQDDFSPTPGFHCKYCDFKEICEHRGK
ncbi:RecB family exonuclease, partial [Patescibacteria group bacterium]